MGKLADGIFWGPGSIWACCAVQWSLCLSFKNCIGKLADRIIFWCPGPTAVGFGVPFVVSGLYKFIGKLAGRIFFGN